MYLPFVGSTCVVSFFLLTTCLVSAGPILKPKDAKTPNANHIFNAIHSSMRQWGSSLNHNGMSFFMATVPAGTQLYHGTGSKEVVKGMEWLAFEPEHALIFARPHGGPPKERPGHGGGDDRAREGFDNSFEDGRGDRCHLPFKDTHDPWSRQGHAHTPPPSEFNGPPGPDGPLEPPSHHPPRPLGPRRVPSTDGPLPLPAEQPLTNIHTAAKGYLHTYIPTRPLSLLYIDGLSAGKTRNGTLDAQDKLLLNLTTPPDSPLGGELARAHGLCELASSLWENRIDGVLRMEAGFEIILCDFEGSVERKNVVAYDFEREERRGPGRVMGGFRYIKAVSERYHGIGGERVTLAYDRFVSVFAFDGEGKDDMGLWKNDVVSDTPHPRLLNASPEQLKKIKDAVTDMILKRRDGQTEERNWQAVADMVVKRYSTPLHYLHTDASVRGSKEAFASYLSTLLRPFVMPSARNTTLETERCIAQFVPPFSLDNPPSLAHATIHTVTSHICSTLLNAFDASTLTLSRSLAATSSPPYHALDLVDNLVGYLQWTTWKECGPCADEEVCFIPIWPMGSLEDHKTPRCVREDGVGTGYWGRMGPPPDVERPGKDNERSGFSPPSNGPRGRPEGPRLRNGDDELVRPSPIHDRWRHGTEGRMQHGYGRSSACGHGVPRLHRPSPSHDDGRVWRGWAGHGHGLWNRVRVGVTQVVEWFCSTHGTHHVDVDVRIS